MTDREKDIKGLHQHCEGSMFDRCGECPYYEMDFKPWEESKFKCRDELLSDVSDLLKKQEAKPVIVTTNAYGTRFYHCPKCNRDLYVYPRQLYCSNCGQAVKWNA